MNNKRRRVFKLKEMLLLNSVKKNHKYPIKFWMMTDYPLALKDGTEISAGTDITEFFTRVYDDDNSLQFKVTKKLLDILNLPANKKCVKFALMEQGVVMRRLSIKELKRVKEIAKARKEEYGCNN